MIFKLIADIIFYLLTAIFAVYSFLATFVLVRYGKSRLMSIIISAFFLIVMISLFGAAQTNLQAIPFNNLVP